MKKASATLLASILGIAFSILVLHLGQVASAQAAGKILYVAPGSACGGGVPNCYANPQAAVDAASPGDEIRVAAGTYKNLSVRPRRDIATTGFVTQTLYLRKTVTIRGGYSKNFSTWNPNLYASILDAHGKGRGIYVTGNISPIIEGLRITGGNAAGMNGYSYVGQNHDAGGGVYVMTANVTLSEDQIYNNTAPYGGGVFLSYSNGQLNGNKVFKNKAQSSGGGMFVYEGNPTLNANEVTSNTSNNLGGGLYLFSTTATLMGNTIHGNSATSIGGGLDVASCSPTLRGNIFSGNSANSGGGAFLWYSNQSVLTNNTFINNQANISGSALWLGGSRPRLLHTTFNGNSGGDGSGVTVDDAGSTHSTLTITNTIIANQSVGISLAAGNSATINGVLWFNTPTKVSHAGATLSIQHQYLGNPAFKPDGYHLTSGSAAIDKGVAAGVLTDIDGQPRPVQAPDLGADEYWAPGNLRYIYLPVVATQH